MKRGIAFSRCSEKTYNKICKHFKNIGFYIDRRTELYEEGDKCLVIDFIDHRIRFTRLLDSLKEDERYMHIEIKE